MRSYHSCVVLSLTILFLLAGVTSEIQAFPISEPFETLPSWNSTDDAIWGGPASFTIESGGEDGNFLQGYRDVQGSSARAKVYTVPSHTDIIITVFIRCPEAIQDYKVETGYSLGYHTAQEFNNENPVWRTISRFDRYDGTSWPNGNSNTWTQYAASIHTGSQTRLSIGFKMISFNTCGSVSTTVGWDSLEITAGVALTPTPTPGFQPTATPVTRDFPSSAPPGQLRLVSWNIEFLGARNPLRTQAQLDALAARILTFDASVLALQEIASPSTFEYVRSQMGPSWAAYHAGVQNALLYDTSKVEPLSLELLSSLADPPYTTYPSVSERRPITGVFRAVDRSVEPFRVIGVHCHWNDESVRSAEGEWLRAKILEYLDDPGETDRIFLMGDYNGVYPCPPHWEILTGGGFSLLPKQNGDSTFVFGGSGIDHCTIPQALRSKLPIQSAFVIRPEHYGENDTQFEATYSDHLPVFIEFDVQREPSAVDSRYWRFK